MKHINIRYHLIRQTVASSAINLSYCPTDDMAADAFTKALPKWRVVTHATTLGMCYACGGVLDVNSLADD